MYGGALRPPNSHPSSSRASDRPTRWPRCVTRSSTPTGAQRPALGPRPSPRIHQLSWELIQIMVRINTTNGQTQLSTKYSTVIKPTNTTQNRPFSNRRKRRQKTRTTFTYRNPRHSPTVAHNIHLL